MNESISLVVEEHESIRRMLWVLRAMCRSAMHGEEVDQVDFTAAIGFIRNYTDHHHHKKEEEYLFKATVANMGKINEDLVAHDMLVEHDLGRGHVFALTEALERFRQDSSDDNRPDIIAEAMDYAALLDRHIEKENTVVYPFAERSLSPETFAEINAASAVFETDSAEQALRDKYKAIADRLEMKYGVAARDLFYSQNYARLCLFDTCRKGQVISIYNYSVPSVGGEELKLLDYKGKVMLIVNTATGYDFTPHYEPLETVYEADHDKGLEIIDIPYNQSAGQTPGTDEEIHESCTLKYYMTLLQQKKSEVNGKHELPLYTLLKSQQGFAGFGKGLKVLMMSALLLKQDRYYVEKPDIRWNFTEFVVDHDGNVVKRFEPTVDMAGVSAFVESLL